MISVGLPAYKTKFIGKAIKSVLNQTYKDFELIIVNDASPEDIKTIVNKFDDPRIKYHENENNLGKCNTVENWNKVLNYAKGEYFVLFSDDDIYEPTFLEEMYELLLKYPDVDIAHCRVKIIDENDNIIDYSPSCPEYESAIDFMWHRLKGLRNQYAPDFMVKTNKLKKLGGFINFPLAWGSDDATWFSIAKDNGIVFLNKPLCSWRKSNYNLSTIGNLELRIKANIIYNNWISEYVNYLKPEDQDDKIKIKHIKHLIPKWRRNNIINLYLVTTRNSFLGLLTVLINWLKYKRQYKLENKIFLTAFIKKIKIILTK